MVEKLLTTVQGVPNEYDLKILKVLKKTLLVMVILLKMMNWVKLSNYKVIKELKLVNF